MPKIEKKRTLTKILRLVRKILASYTANCNFHHKSNFPSKTLTLTKSFADSELVGIVCLCYEPKKRERANINENIETLNFSVLYGKLRLPPQIQLFCQNTYSDQIFRRFRTGWTSMFVFCARKREKANINENIETLNFSVLYGKLRLPPQIQLFCQNTYSDQIFRRFRSGWNSMFVFCAKKREKANINENIETLNFSVLYGKLRLPPQIQLFCQNTYSDQIFRRFRSGWNSMFKLGAKKREKAKINENIEILSFSVLCAKLQFPTQI